MAKERDAIRAEMPVSPISGISPGTPRFGPVRMPAKTNRSTRSTAPVSRQIVGPMLATTR